MRPFDTTRPRRPHSVNGSDPSAFAAQVAAMHAANHVLLAERILREAVVDLPRLPRHGHPLDMATSLRAVLEPLLDQHIPELFAELLTAGRAIYPRQLIDSDSIAPERGSGA